MKLWKYLNKIYLFCLSKVGKTGIVSFILGIGVVVSVYSTYHYMTKESGLNNANIRSVTILIIVDLIFLLAFAGVTLRKLSKLVIQRKQRVIGSKLQTKIIFMFLLIASIPTLLMTIFSAMFLNFGIQSWFDDKVSLAIKGSVNIAKSYVDDHKNIIKADIRSIASDISNSALLLSSNNELFNRVVSGLARGSLSEVIVFTSDGKIIAKNDLAFSLTTNPPTKEELHRADLGEIVILNTEGNDKVSALMHLDNFLDAYLIVSRYIDPDILKYVEETQGAANQYNTSKNNILELQVKFLIIFIIISLLLLLIVVWFALIFSVNLVKPVQSLLLATNRVKAGDLTVRVTTDNKKDEMAKLAKAFNSMIEQLERQRVELESAHRFAAWSDVARRIAHEIKNPLTPIQLASERLYKKFGSQVSDKAIFEKYLNTIVNNAANIGHMVEEFVNFARLPAPVFNNYDICELLNDLVFSRQNISQNTVIEKTIPPEPIILNGDISQITRVFINLLKNAEESIEELRKNKNENIKGVITVIVILLDKKICRVQILDNGMGFSDNMINVITEPYVTTKSKGTGLGLSIVKKIIEDHNATISFSNTNNGACVTVDFYVNH